MNIQKISYDNNLTKKGVEKLHDAMVNKAIIENYGNFQKGKVDFLLVAPQKESAHAEGKLEKIKTFFKKIITKKGQFKC